LLDSSRGRFRSQHGETDFHGKSRIRVYRRDPAAVNVDGAFDNRQPEPDAAARSATIGFDAVKRLE
jgi:hypothetical protein